MRSILLKDLIITIESGSRPKGGATSSGIPSLGGENINEANKLSFNKQKLISIDHFLKMKQGVIEFEDILIVKDGATTGRVGFVDNEFPYEKAAINEHLFRIKVDKKKILPKYLYFYLISPMGKSQVMKDFRGATIGGITKNFIELVKVPLPSISVQEKTINVLSEIVSINVKRQYQIATLDKLTQSVFLEMFGNPESNKNNYPVKSIMEFYENAKAAVKCGPFGSALKKNEYVPNGVPVWNMDNITKNNEFIDEPSLFVTQEKADELQSYDVRNGDIIISRAGTVGKMCVVDSRSENSLISTNLIRLRLNSKLKPEFLVWLIRIFGDRVCRMRTGNEGAFTHMNTSVLNSIEFPYPPLAEQEKFLALLVKLRKDKDQLLKSSLIEMESLYNSLLQKAFKGELFQE